MVTPEMLLWLAGKMGLTASSERNGPLVFVRSDSDRTWSIFNPATDDAQFGRLVVWAAQHDCVTAVYPQEAAAWLYENNPSGCSHHERHDSTTDSIRAAAVVAIARALGWEGANVPDA